jgi:hypothetical protein
MGAREPQMLTRLRIRLSLEATVAALQDNLHRQPQLEQVGQTVRRGRNMFVVHVLSDDARPVNLFCRRLVEAGLVEDVTVQRLDV